jgi:hypothetical protein
LRNTDKWSIQKEHNYGANRSIIPTESKWHQNGSD